jgi:hypothetical protein
MMAAMTTAVAVMTAGVVAVTTVAMVTADMEIE